MAVIDHTHAPYAGGTLQRIIGALGAALRSFSEARARKAELEHYTSMSDRQLAELGLRREQIVQHVFRDLYL